MFSRSLFAGTAIATILALWGSSAAVAAPIDLGGYTGPAKVNFDDFEFFTGTQTLSASTANGGSVSVPAPALNSFNYGIFQVNSVTPLFGPNILNTSQYVYLGVFDNIQTTAVNSFSGASGIGFTGTTTGGVFQLYQIPVGSINITNVELQGLAGFTTGGCSVNTLCYNGLTNATGATMVLQFDLGTNSIHPTYTLYDTNVSPTAADIVNTGSASATGTVTAGADANQFGGLGAILTVTNNFCFNNGTGTAQCGSGIDNASNTANNFELLSQDPVRVNITNIPEPASLALFGAGIFGLGVFGRRRRRAK